MDFEYTYARNKKSNYNNNNCVGGKRMGLISQ